MTGNRATISFSLFLLLFGVSGSAAAPREATVTVRLVDRLGTGSSHAGESFAAVLAAPLVVNDHLVAAKESQVTGQVREVVSGGPGQRPALLRLSLQTLQGASRRIPLETVDLTLKASPQDPGQLVVSGGRVGPASAGAAGAYLTRKGEIVLGAETWLSFQLTSIVVTAEEMGRLEQVPHRTGDLHSVAARRRPGKKPTEEKEKEEEEAAEKDEGEDEGEEEEEEETEYEFERPKRIEIEVEGREVEVKIRWPRRLQRLTLKGDDLEEIIEEVAQRTGLSVELLRQKAKIKRKE